MVLPIAPAPTEENASRRAVVALTCIWAGMMISESIYTGLLPLTLSRFTSDVALIGWILALKPGLSIVVQPLAGIITDKIWTPVGRRGLFLILFSPLLGACLYYLPDMTRFWQVVLLASLFQFFQDVLWGSDHPLLADLIPPHQRTFVMGLMTSSSQMVAFLFFWICMGMWMGQGNSSTTWIGRLIDGANLSWITAPHGEAYVYKFAAIAQTILVGGLTFFLGEKPVERIARPRLTLRRYCRDFLGDPILRKFGLLALVQNFFQNLVISFVGLFAVKTLLLSAAEYGHIWKWQALVAISAFLFGGTIETLPKQWVMACGYGLSTVGCLVGYFATDGAGLLAVSFIFGVGQLIGNMTQKPFFTEYVPKDIIGQITGAYNTAFAISRTLALGFGGMLVKATGDNYRSIWGLATLMGVITVLICATIPDVRYTQRKCAR